MKKIKLMLGDNMDSLKKLPDNSIDSVVTDPPYGINFMGKKWDYQVPTKEFWIEVMRVLKPGGHILSFCGTRTYHRMVVNIEDAGFEIRDCISWLYGSGFPKSHNIGKAVDKFGGNNMLSKEIGIVLKQARLKRGLTLKAADDLFCGGTSNYNWLEGRIDGQRIPIQELFDKIVLEWPELKEIRDKVIQTEREVLGTTITNKTIMQKIGEKNISGEINITKGTSEYEGWGTALKPAQEIICVARKPLSEDTVAKNVLKWGTGGINVDGCRVGNDMISHGTSIMDIKGKLGDFHTRPRIDVEDHITEGRFPANIIFECICDNVIKGEKGENSIAKHKNSDNLFGKFGSNIETTNYNDTADIHTNPDCPCYILDKQSGERKVGKGKRSGGFQKGYIDGKVINRVENEGYNDKGGASRFFYIAKVSKKERNMGLDNFEDKKGHKITNFEDYDRLDGTHRNIPHRKNFHPTLKPINLMTYLCRLVTPINGIVLDPFMGSGSTGIAARLEGFRFVGMELDEDYFKIATARIEVYEEYRKLLK